MKTRPALIAAAVALALTMTGCSAAAAKPTPTPTRTLMQQAMDKCDLISVSPGLSLGDENHTMILDGKGDDDTDGMTYETQRCLLKALDVTDAAMSEIEQTRALDGKQEASWGKVNASWRYHPDSGLEMTLTEK